MLSPQDLAIKKLDRLLWELLRDRMLNCYIDSKSKEDVVFFTLKNIPKNAKIISQYTKQNVKRATSIYTIQR